MIFERKPALFITAGNYNGCIAAKKAINDVYRHQHAYAQLKTLGMEPINPKLPLSIPSSNQGL